MNSKQKLLDSIKTLNLNNEQRANLVDSIEEFVNNKSNTITIYIDAIINNECILYNEDKTFTYVASVDEAEGFYDIAVYNDHNILSLFNIQYFTELLDIEYICIKGQEADSILYLKFPITMCNISKYGDIIMGYAPMFISTGEEFITLLSGFNITQEVDEVRNYNLHIMLPIT